RWVEVDANFEIVGEDVDPDQGAFTAMEICNHAGDADPHLWDRVYTDFLDALVLSEHHRQALRDRKMPAEQIELRQYRSLEPFAINQAVGRLRESHGDDKLLKVPGFAACDGNVIFLQAGLKGILIPVRDLMCYILALLVRQDRGDAKYL